MREVRLGLIGTGFMGKCHALAFRAASATFDGLPAVRPTVLADVDGRAVERLGRTFGFEHVTTRWQEVVEDPAVDLVAITTPNFLHEEMGLAALRARKHVYCEKPLALDAAGARRMAEAAARTRVRTLVGYNYLRSPAVGLTRTLIDDGEIGEVIHVRVAHLEDYMSDPAGPATWRTSKRTAGAGALGDLGSHAISMARHLAGPIEAVMGDIQTVIRERPDPDNPAQLLPVDVDDQAQALLRFASGASGTLEASWLAAGRKMGLTFEITGTGGAILFDQERMNELRVFKSADARRDHGFKTILMGAEHPPYAAFCPAPGHGLGFNDLKTIEVKALVEAIAAGTPVEPDFEAGYEIARVVEAIQRSAAERRWIRATDVA